MEAAVADGDHHHHQGEDQGPEIEDAEVVAVLVIAAGLVTGREAGANLMTGNGPAVGQTSPGASPTTGRKTTDQRVAQEIRKRMKANLGPSLVIAPNQFPNLRVAQKVQENPLQKKKKRIQMWTPQEMKETMREETNPAMMKIIDQEVAARTEETLVIKMVFIQMFLSSSCFVYCISYHIRILKMFGVFWFM